MFHMFKLNIPSTYNANSKQTNPRVKQVIITTPVQHPEMSIHSLNYDRTSALLNYIQSLLKWTYKENPEFSKYLEEDELVTWYVHHMEHPLWFKEELGADGLRLVADMTDYVRQHKDDAELYDIVDNIKCTVAEVNGKR